MEKVILKKVERVMNPEREIIIILDNFGSHHSKAVAETAVMLNIRLI